MIHGVGVDLVQVPRMEAAMSRFGERFARRILSDAELARFREGAGGARFLAKHFAAKEALLKALGTGLRCGIGWHHLELDHDPLGKPVLICTGRAAALLRQRGVGATHLSLSDDGEYAVAFVTLTR